MEKIRLRKLIGVAMVTFGLIQVGFFALADDWTPSVFGLIFAVLGVVYLWAEVYSTAR